ncbi:unnamed protein product [Closterium sp. Naga37s-1]|nr:unnamed protein product [Closterium sp. Naga37s-1]
MYACQFSISLTNHLPALSSSPHPLLARLQAGTRHTWGAAATGKQRRARQQGGSSDGRGSEGEAARGRQRGGGSKGEAARGRQRGGGSKGEAARGRQQGGGSEGEAARGRQRGGGSEGEAARGRQRGGGSEGEAATALVGWLSPPRPTCTRQAARQSVPACPPHTGSSKARRQRCCTTHGRGEARRLLYLWDGGSGMTHGRHHCCCPAHHCSPVAGSTAVPSAPGGAEAAVLHLSDGLPLPPATQLMAKVTLGHNAWAWGGQELQRRCRGEEVQRRGGAEERRCQNH